MKPMALLRKTFGMQPGQSLSGFSAECKALEAACGSREAFLSFCEECATFSGVTLDRS